METHDHGPWDPQSPPGRFNSGNNYKEEACQDPVHLDLPCLFCGRSIFLVATDKLCDTRPSLLGYSASAELWYRLCSSDICSKPQGHSAMRELWSAELCCAVQ